MISKLKNIFEESTFQHKFKAKDLSFTTENGEPVFYGLVCVGLGMNNEFTQKDSEKMINLTRQIKSDWWKVRFDEYGAGFWLHYYPMRREGSDCRQHLDHIADLFTHMVEDIK